MTFLKSIPAKYLLLLVIILGFGLRATNLTAGFPILYISNDEAVYHLSALNMIADKTPFTIGNYGPLGAYLQIPFLLLAYLVFLVTGKVENVSDFEFLIVTHEGYFLFIPRVISALFGTLVIIAAYLISKELFKRREVAIFSAIVSAISFNMVHISHLARSWSPAIFFSMIAVLFAIRATTTLREYQKLAAVAVVFSAISFGFHQFGGLSIILVGLILASAKLKFTTFLKRTIPCIALFSVLVLIFNSLSLGSNVLDILNPYDKHNSTELVSITGDLATIYQNAGLFLKNLFLTDYVIVILFIIFFLTNLKHKGIFRSFIIFTFFNLLLAILIFPPFVVRYFLIAFAFLPIFAGFGLNEVYKKTGSTVVVLLIILIASFNSIYFNFLIARVGTFNQVRDWLDSHVPSTTPIIATTHRNLGYVPNATATSEIRKTNEGFYGRAAELVGDGYAHNVRYIIYANQFASLGQTKDDYVQRALDLYDAKIIVDSYLSADNRLLNMQRATKFNLLAHFSPTDGQVLQKPIPETFFDSATVFPLFVLKRPGPYFDVLEITD